MNIRKNIDYGEMYIALDHAMAAQMEQMELYCAIGKAVSLRSEKGAAVAAAKYLAENYPDAHGFSPRNVRRMRDFYRTYENHPVQLEFALRIGWTQNVVILEADLPMELREWYLRAAKQFDWSKIELAERIATNAHEEIVLAIEDDVRNVVEQAKPTGISTKKVTDKRIICDLIRRFRLRWRTKEGDWRSWFLKLIRYTRRNRSVPCDVRENKFLAGKYLEYP